MSDISEGLHEWHYRMGITGCTCMSGITEWAYPDVRVRVALQSGHIQMYVHEWDYRVGIPKCTCMSGITGGHTHMHVH